MSRQPFTPEAGSVIGVATLFNLDNLKRALLLVDRICVIQNSKEDWYCRKRDPALAANLDFLKDRNVILEADSNFGVEVIDKPGEYKLILRNHLAENQLIIPVSQLIEAISVAKGARAGSADALSAFCDGVCRTLCDHLATDFPVQVVSLSHPVDTLPEIAGKDVRAADVQRVIIQKFPYPDDSTSLERLLDFRDDLDVKRMLVSLRRWASSVLATRSEAEIAQELDYLLREYEHYMKVHELKIKKRVWETVLTATAETAEHASRLRFGQMAKSLFSISSRKIDLLEAELNAPGREIAYLSRVHKAFGRR
jgi:hypothetical protein